MAPGSLNRRRLCRNGLIVAAACAAELPLFGDRLLGGSELQQPESKQTESKQIWTVTNGIISRTMSFAPKTGLLTERLSDTVARTEFIAPNKAPVYMAEEFYLNCNGERCAGTSGSFELLDAHESAQSNGSSLAIRLKHKSVALEVALVYRVYAGHAAIRKHLVLKNTGAAVLHISHLAIEAIAVSLGAADEITLLTQYGTIPREIFYTGRSEDAGMLLANGRTGAGLAIVSEVPGWMKRTEIGGWDDPKWQRIGVLYDTDLMPFERSLAAGEEFSTAAVSLVAFRNGDGFNDPHWRLPAYAAQVLERKIDAQGPPWIYNTWEPFTRNIHHDIVLELIDAAGEMGMDIFTIDDGWQSEYGENAVNLPAFPGGLKPIQDALAAKRMRLGLWVPVAAIGTGTEVYRNHPEWAAKDIDGKAKTTGTAAGTKAVMCMASAYRDEAAARIIDAIERFDLAYVKLDLTTVFNAYGEAPGCWAKGHFHNSWAESLGMIYEGMAAMTAAVYKKHPDVLLDLTFELWGQKHVIDAGLLAAGDLDWMSNVDDKEPDSAGPLQARQLLYQRAATMPAEAMLIGNMHGNQPSIAERFATAMGSAPVMLGDLRKLSAADRKWYGEKIAWFKKLRHAAKLSESFFPLGSWLQTTPTAWDGFARLDRSGKGVIALFRNKSNEAAATVKLPLMPAGRFGLRSMIRNKELGAYGAAEFARGVTVTFPEHEPVEVLEVSAGA